MCACWGDAPCISLCISYVQSWKYISFWDIDAPPAQIYLFMSDVPCTHSSVIGWMFSPNNGESEVGLLLSYLLTYILSTFPARRVDTVRVASAALRCCTVQNHIQCAVPVCLCGGSSGVALPAIGPSYEVFSQYVLMTKTIRVFFQRRTVVKCHVLFAIIYIFLWQKRHERSSSDAQ